MDICRRKVSMGNGKQQRSTPTCYLPFDSLKILTPKASPVKSQAVEGRQAVRTVLMQLWEDT